MPPRNWAFCVQDILDAIAKIQRYVSDVYAGQLPRGNRFRRSPLRTTRDALPSSPAVLTPDGMVKARFSRFTAPERV